MQSTNKPVTPQKVHAVMRENRNKYMEKTNGFGFFNRVDWQTYDYVLGLLHDAANELELETELEERLQPILKNVELSIKAMHDALTAAKLSGLYRDPDFP